MTSDLAPLLAAVVIGYLVGSISFARVVGRVVSPATRMDGAVIDLGEVGMRDGMQVRMDGISATSVSVQLGRRWGFVTSVLDVLKAALVTLAFRAALPEDSAYLVAAVFVVVGHNWPLWHRFHGGFGVSPMLGGLLVVDPLGLVVSIGLGKAASSRLAALCCFKNRLPQGAPTSPMITNMICRRMDARLHSLLEKYGGRYTRYADDLTFSGDEAILSVLPLVRTLVREEGFEQAPEKFRIQRRGGRQKVTGLVVNCLLYTSDAADDFAVV